MYSKSKVFVATVTHATLYAFASDVVRSCKKYCDVQCSFQCGGNMIVILSKYCVILEKNVRVVAMPKVLVLALKC